MKKTAIIFPGQGSQFVGMGKEFLETEAEARALMAMAEKRMAPRRAIIGALPDR